MVGLQFPYQATILMFRGDGFVVSTATGSTGYALLLVALLLHRVREWFACQSHHIPWLAHSYLSF